MRDVASAAGRDPALDIAGIHIFTFGGVAQAAAWANGLVPGGR